MFHFLGFLFIIIIAILLIGLSIIGTVIRSIFGLGSRRSSNTYRNDNGNYQRVFFQWQTTIRLFFQRRT